MADLERRETETGRLPNGRFGPGNPGKPKGAVHRRNAAVMQAIGDLSSAAVAVLKQKLAEGDPRVAMFILARFTPAERLVETGTTDPNAIADLAAEGFITPTELNRLAQGTKTLREAADLAAIRDRLDELETLVVRMRGQA